MPAEPDPPVTELLLAAQAGDAGAAERLLAVVYEQLHQLARARMAHLPPGQTLQPTALVHEAYLRLTDKLIVSRPGTLLSHRQGWTPIPGPDGGKTATCDHGPSRQPGVGRIRCAVERGHAFLAQFGRIAHRLDRLSKRFLGWVKLAAAIIFLRTEAITTAT